MDWTDAAYYTIPAYHLTEEIVNDFLKSIFDNYDFYTSLEADHYKFWIPRALTQWRRQAKAVVGLSSEPARKPAQPPLDIAESDRLAPDTKYHDICPLLLVYSIVRLSEAMPRPNLTDSELLSDSCSKALLFPNNIVRQTTPQHHLDSYSKRLKEREPFLFSEDGAAALDILEYDDPVKGFQHTCAKNTSQLKDNLEGVPSHSRKDPRCRFIFPIASHARDRLKISHKMLVAALTHHQVMVSFLDFIFPFGMQEYLEDFYFSGLREETRLSSPAVGLVIPELGRSGRDIRLCYNLKSVERSSDKFYPWSIRQAAVYHSFDIKNGNALWIMIKGNQLLKKRIQDSTAKDAVGSPDLKLFESNCEAFASSLATHLVLADWCDEEWRWYLNYLEERLHAATRPALTIMIEREPSIYESPVNHHARANTTPSMASKVATVVKKTLSRKHRNSNSNPGLPLGNIPVQTPFPMTAGPPAPLGGRPPPPPMLPPGMPGSIPTEKQQLQEEERQFTLQNLQVVQFLEEKANEVSPILVANIDILRELSEHYKLVLSSDDCPDELKSGCQTHFRHFEKRIKSIITDLERQKSRTQILLGLLSNRKNLLYEISNKRAVETSRISAKRAQLSTDRMEKMTDAMFEIAKKTQKETVSMKIITLVTLFFLPGTFISVSFTPPPPKFISARVQHSEIANPMHPLIQTIMSTDIIKFQDNAKEYQWGALNWYIMVTIPFMFATFVSWYGFYWWTARKERLALAESGDLEKK
ncbi:hypothetical protein EG329_014326 [Mollisiaceae sp. DMI_Dod_QoI]|nr:hypothetical protein EG329_014326 [Helotiales sp. DMI_Dod_QoI]